MKGEYSDDNNSISIDLKFHKVIEYLFYCLVLMASIEIIQVLFMGGISDIITELGKTLIVLIVFGFIFLELLFKVLSKRAIRDLSNTLGK